MEKDDVPDFVKKNFWEFRPNRKGINAFLAAFLLSFGVYVLFNYIFNDISKGAISVWPFFLAWVFFTVFLYDSDYIKRIWGRTFVGLTIISFLMPIAVFIFGVKQTVKQTDTFSAAGTAIGTGIATIFVGFLAFFFGIVFLVAAIFTYKSISRPVTIEKKKSK